MSHACRGCVRVSQIQRAPHRETGGLRRSPAWGAARVQQRRAGGPSARRRTWLTPLAPRALGPRANSPWGARRTPFHAAEALLRVTLTLEDADLVRRLRRLGERAPHALAEAINKVSFEVLDAEEEHVRGA